MKDASKGADQDGGGLKEYRVRRAGSPPLLDGSLDDPVWSRAEPLQDLILPWSSETPQQTDARFLWDDDYLYAGFRVWDEDVVTQTPSDPAGKMAVANHDRVEVFFSTDPELSLYYGFEINPLGRVLDYKCSFHRQFDFSWSSGIRVAARLTGQGYAVEAAFSLAEMEALGLPHPRQAGQWRAGVYRADFRRGAAGDIEQLWQSWVDPRVSDPDFHVPSSFGIFRFQL